MKRIFKYAGLILSSIFLSCSAGKGASKKEVFDFGRSTYEITLPKVSYKKQIIDNGGESKEIRFTFSDSTTLFFTDSKSATPLVSKFLSSNDYLKFTDEENLKYEFAEGGSLFFLEKRDNLFIGYANTPKMNKLKIDAILSTFKKK